MASYTIERIPPEPDPYRRPGYRAPDRFVVRGTLPPGPFVFEHPPWGSTEEPRYRGSYEFNGVTAVEGAFVFDQVGWSCADSSFTRCVFSQAASRKAGAERSGGMFGRGWSTFEDCMFDHIDFGQRGGGFSVRHARFERCTFRYCRFRAFHSSFSDFVDCTFVGLMQSAWFWGATIPGDQMQRTNRFVGNDLTLAKPRRVYFRNGIDLSANRLPDGPEYILLDRFPDRLDHARAIVAAWPEEERRHAEFILDIYREDNLDVFFAWRRILAGPPLLWQVLETIDLTG